MKLSINSKVTGAVYSDTYMVFVTGTVYPKTHMVLVVPHDM
jgi:hypothetical protein